MYKHIVSVFSLILFISSTYAQCCLDSIRIKGYLIDPSPTDKYYELIKYNHKSISGYNFNGVNSYYYFLPLDSITPKKPWSYWIKNHYLMERNHFSLCDTWLIEKRYKQLCHIDIKIEPQRIKPITNVVYEHRKQNQEVTYKIIFIDGYYNLIKVNRGQEGELLWGCYSQYLQSIRDDYFNLYILRKLISCDTNVVINDKLFRRIR